jgi:hypothetical protein
MDKTKLAALIKSLFAQAEKRAASRPLILSGLHVAEALLLGLVGDMTDAEASATVEEASRMTD